MDHPDWNMFLCGHLNRAAPDGLMPTCNEGEECPMGGPFPFGYFKSEREGGCFLCTDGVPMKHEEYNYLATLSIVDDRENRDSPVSKMLKLYIQDDDEGIIYAECFPVYRCPICGRSLR